MVRSFAARRIDPLDGGQAERVRVPLADGTLVATPELPPVTSTFLPLTSSRA